MHLVLRQALARYSTAFRSAWGRQGPGTAGLEDFLGFSLPHAPQQCGGGGGNENGSWIGYSSYSQVTLPLVPRRPRDAKKARPSL
jgi:hypothetical protein